MPSSVFLHCAFKFGSAAEKSRTMANAMPRGAYFQAGFCFM
jgi:hypothetical protein